MVKLVYLVAALASLVGFFFFIVAYTGIGDRRRQGQEDEVLLHPFRSVFFSLWRPVIPQRLHSTFSWLRSGLIILSGSLLVIVIVSLIKLLSA